MAHNQVEIHDPFSKHNHLNNGTNRDLPPTSDTDAMGDTVELRLLMAYAKRRRPKKDAKPAAQGDPVAQSGDALLNGPSSPQTPPKTEKEVKEERKKKKKKGWKRVYRILSCLKPQIEEPLPATVEKPVVCDRSGPGVDESEDEVTKEDELDEVASRLTEIADDVPFVPPELEVDAPEDEVEKVIGLLLRDAGDRLNERELKNANIAKELFWNYGFFQNLLTTLLKRMGLIPSEPDALGPQASLKTQIAVTCEVTSRLSAVDTLPMSRMLDHGARYLQDHYSSWVQQQGGYEKAFEKDDEDDVQ